MTHEQEARELLDKHIGPRLMVTRIGAIAAISEALRQRDQAREEHRFALAAESAAIATLTAQRDKAVEALKAVGDTVLFPREDTKANEAAATFVALKRQAAAEIGRASCRERV